MSDVSALMDKLKTTVSYKQFDAPRASDQTWPVLEKIARAQSALADPQSQSLAPEAQATAPATTAVAAGAAAEPVTQAVAPAPSPAAAPNPAPASGSLFARLQVDAASPKAGAFGRYTVGKPAEDGPQALSEIFERIGRKAV
ncbi:hypothetical protein [Caulobacter segnis]|nr:hypothetical protein [Caulobacter segnis]